METNDPELQRLLEGYFDGRLNDAETKRLGEWLRDDPEARAAYHEMAGWHAAFSAWGEQRAGGEAAREWEDSHETVIARPRSFWRRAVPLAAAAALIVIGFFTWQVRDRAKPLGELTFAQHAEWTGEGPRDGVELQRRSYQLASGVVRFETSAGAIVTISGPADFDFVAEDRIELRQGKLTARMLRDDSRLTVKVGEMEVRDLGTAFGVDANNMERTLVSVFDGLVAVTSRATPGEEMRLGEGKSFVAPRDASSGAIPTAFDPESFRDLWPLTVGINEASRLVEFLPPGPLLKPMREYRGNDRLFLFPERQNVVTDRPIDIDLSGDAPVWPDSPASPYPLPRGERVDSYLVFFQPEAAVGAPRQLKGEITFQRPVLGVICSDYGLDKSDAVLGDGAADYLAPGERRGLEEADKEHNRGNTLPHDSLRLSADRRTLYFDFYVSIEREQIRVIVASH
jgi:ferric-dicitrate binding protein FerR (iron transport regulator)